MRKLLLTMTVLLASIAANAQKSGNGRVIIANGRKLLQH